MAAAFGESIEIQFLFGQARYKVHDARVGVSAVNRGLGAANHFDTIQKIHRNMRKVVEIAAEAVDWDTVDLKQVEIGISTANEQRGYGATPARLRHAHAGQIADEIDGLRFIALEHLVARHDADA